MESGIDFKGGKKLIMLMEKINCYKKMGQICVHQRKHKLLKEKGKDLKLSKWQHSRWKMMDEYSQKES